jgi:hypothetical protein
MWAAKPADRTEATIAHMMEPVLSRNLSRRDLRAIHESATGWNFAAAGVVLAPV